MRRISELRKHLGLSQAELAQRLSIAQNTLSQYETGKREPDNKTLIKLADFFDVTTDYLLGKDDSALRKLQEDKKPTTSQDDELSQLLEDPDTKALYERIKDFSDDELEDLLNYSEYLISKRDSRKKK